MTKTEQVCANNKCNDAQCCYQSPCTTMGPTTTVTTTPAPIVTTTLPTTVTTTPAPTVTTTLPTTVTTTPQLTCADFKCPPKYSTRTDAICANNQCNAAQCCYQ